MSQGWKIKSYTIINRVHRTTLWDIYYCCRNPDQPSNIKQCLPCKHTWEDSMTHRFQHCNKCYEISLNETIILISKTSFKNLTIESGEIFSFTSYSGWICFQNDFYPFFSKVCRELWRNQALSLYSLRHNRKIRKNLRKFDVIIGKSGRI